MPTVASDSSFGLRVPAPRRALDPVRVRSVDRTLVRVRIWDLPTRVFHWSLAASLVGLTATGYAGGAWMDWHGRMGSLVLALLLFRIVWGFAGGRWSRFAAFWPTPSRVRSYLQGPHAPEHKAGHNPLGALSILAMLLLLFAQVATGLVGDDGGGYSGPLNAYVSSAFGLAATLLHKQVGQWLLFGLVLLHVAAIVFYRIARRRKLVRAMIDGDQRLEYWVPPSRDDARSRLQAAVLMVGCVLLVGLVTGF
jgi:cytochrome b